MAGRRRTTHRSVSGKKLYAVRDSKGRFVDIQTYERAHRADVKKKSKTILSLTGLTEGTEFLQIHLLP